METKHQSAYSIKEAASELGLSEVYIRRMIQQGKIETQKQQVGDTEVWRHMITAETLNEWRSGSSVHTTRNDGRSKFVCYATASELAAIQDFLKDSGNKAIIEKANKPEDVKRRYAKSKLRRAAKKAELRAAKQG
jgi:excisionase family DNA binding protein